MDIIVAFMLLSGFFVAWNTGANDAANCIGVPVGANILRFRKAVILMAIFVVAGALLQGQRVMDTMGSGIVITNSIAYEQHHGAVPTEDVSAALEAWFPTGQVSDLATAVSLLAAGISVFLATKFGLPLSTSQSIVAAVAGVGVAVVGLQPELFRLALLGRIVGSWIISPILTMVTAFVIYKILLRLTRRMRRSLQWEQTLVYLVIVSSCYFAFSMGSNAFGAGLGPMVAKFPEMRTVIALISGATLAFGALIFGRRVTQSVGSEITALDYPGALAAQLAAGIGLQVFARFGVPVSSSQAIVGAVVGVGLVKGVGMVNLAQLKRIFASWFLTPLFAGVLAAALYWVLRLL